MCEWGIVTNVKKLVTVDKEKEIEEKNTFEDLPSGLINKTKKFNPSQNKLMIGSIESGGIFGEEEVVNNTKRKYTATSSAAMTCFYVLKKQVFILKYSLYSSFLIDVL